MKTQTKTSLLRTDVEQLFQSHWGELWPSYMICVGQAPSKHDSPMLDEADFVFQVQQLARINGYVMAGDATANDLRKAMRVVMRQYNPIPKTGEAEALL